MSKASRRSFLAQSIALPALAAPASARPSPVTLLADLPVAGDAYYDINFAWDELDEGSALLLRREPANRVDAKAIALYTPKGLKIGFVPRRDGGPLAALMDTGRSLSATITRTVDYRHPQTGVLGSRQPFYKIDLLD